MGIRAYVCVIAASTAIAGPSLAATSPPGWQVFRFREKAISPGVTDAYVGSMIFAEGRFLGLGGVMTSSGFSTAAAFVSTNGTTWFVHTNNLAPPWQWPGILPGKFNELTYAKGLYVFTSYNAIWTSATGLSWTKTAVITNPQISSSAVAYGNGLFVTVAAYSDDGLNWSAAGAPVLDEDEEISFFSIHYTNGLFMAAGITEVRDDVWASIIATSTNGTNWTRSYLSQARLIGAVTYANGQWLALGRGPFGFGEVLSFTNGSNWVHRRDMAEYALIEDVAYGDGIFLGVGDEEEKVLISSNGVDWVSQSLDNRPVNSPVAVAYGNGVFVIAGSEGGWCSRDFDGARLLQPFPVWPDFITVTGELGRPYRLQAASVVSPPDWRDLISFTLEHSYSTNVMDTGPRAATRFYRVVSP